MGRAGRSGLKVGRKTERRANLARFGEKLRPEVVEGRATGGTPALHGRKLRGLNVALLYFEPSWDPLYQSRCWKMKPTVGLTRFFYLMKDCEKKAVAANVYRQSVLSEKHGFLAA
ncbi:MAG: hypothetical protein JWQ04_3387 [Pedosphaera sp.]|nr:hypothetical protein [Pedosphaera sp.]